MVTDDAGVIGSACLGRKGRRGVGPGSPRYDGACAAGPLGFWASVPCDPTQTLWRGRCKEQGCRTGCCSTDVEFSCLLSPVVSGVSPIRTSRRFPVRGGHSQWVLVDEGDD